MSTRWSPFLKQLVIVGGLLAGIGLLFRVRVVLTPLVLALLLAYLASFPVNGVVRRTGWPRGPVVAVTLILVVLLIAAMSVLVVPWLVSLLRSFGATFVSVIQQLLVVTPKPIAITPTSTVDLGRFYAPINQWLRSLLQPDLSTIQDLQRLLFPFATGAAVVVKGAASGVVWVIFILVVSFYAVKDAPKIYRSIAASVPTAWRPEVRWLWREMASTWDAFVRGRLLLSLLMAFIVSLALSVLGVRNAPALGFLYGLLGFVPAVGPVVAAVLGILISLILGSSWIPLGNLWFAAVVAGTYILLAQFENLYLLPRVVGRRVALHPAIVIVGVVAGAELAGLLGILLAAPIIASFRVLMIYVFRKLFDLEPIPATPRRPRREVLWGELVRDRSVRAVLFDLDGTLVETDDQAVQRLARRLRFLGRMLTEKERLRVARRWLVRSEELVNAFITLLDKLHLDNLLLRLNDKLRRWRGFTAPNDFVAVVGSIETVRTLARKQYALAVVTSRGREDTQAFLAQYCLDGLFCALVTRDDSGRLKPHPMPVRLAAEQLNVPAEQCVMVGDSSVDMRAAKAAGALAVGVLCGFGEKDDFADADLVIESTAQLTEWI